MYSLGGICSKFAGQAEFLSLQFIVLYGLVLLNLFVYAIFWQQILKRLPLVTAYSNKAVTVIWGILWGFLFFGEPVTWKKLAGSLIIIAGVYFVVSDQGQTDTPLQNQASE
jgi:drug/metabolite transporter (DMT)-like permease